MADVKKKKDKDEEEEKEEEPSFELVLDALGPLGKFQMIHASFCYLSVFLTTFIILSFVFEGYEPPHVCNAVNETQLLTKYGLANDSSARVLYEEPCHIEVTANRSSGGKVKAAAGAVVVVASLECPNGRNFFAAKHTTFLSEWDLVCESSGVAELSQTFYNVGQMIGALIGSSIADRYGRRPVFIASQFLATIAEFCVVAAPNIFAVYGLKMISGVFYQSLVCCFFVYALEFITPRHREANGVAMCFIWVVGMMAVGAVGYVFRNDSWRYFQAGVGASGLFCLAYPFVMYESPRWLAATGKTKQALDVLEKASKMNGKDFKEVKKAFVAYVNYAHPSKTRPLQFMGDEQMSEQFVNDNLLVMEDNNIWGNQQDNNKKEEKKDGKKEKKMTMLDLLRYKSLRKTTLITWYLFFTNILTYYGLYMTSSNLAGDRFINFTLLNVVEIPSNMCVYPMMKRMNRRLVLVIFLILTAASLLASTILITWGQHLEGSSQASTILFILGKFAISASFNVVFIVAPEVFPTNVRTMAGGLTSGLARPAGMIAPYLRPLYHVIKWGPGLIFSVMCLLAAILTFMLPESKDANLPETVSDADKKKHTSGKLLAQE